MATTPRDNSGILSANKNKTKPVHPDKKGSATIGGVEYWISGWEKEGQYGPFLSLSFEKKEDQGRPPAPAAPRPRPPASPRPPRDDFEDDTPF
jgi:hypothetical protein